MNIFKKVPYLKYLIVCLLFIAAVPLNRAGILPGSTILVLGSVLLYAVAGMGMNILLGYSGLITLGAAGFMGLAAYLSAFCTGDLGLPFLVSLLISTGVPLIVGLGIGVISLRLEGYYLAIATLGVGEILKQVFVEFEPLTAGFSGKRAGFISMFGYSLTRESTYILYAVILFLVLSLAHNVIYSDTGRSFRAIRGSEPAAQAMGISLLKYRTTAFAISTVLTALAGVMYMHLVQFAYPTTWGLGLSLNFLSIVVIGGMGTIMGSVLGSFFVIAVPELIIKQLPVIGQLSGVAYIFNGIAIVLVMMLYSRGLIHIWTDIKKLFTRGRGKGGESK